MKKKVFLTVSLMAMVFMHNVYALTFSDVSAEHWAYNYITTLSDSGVINGYLDGTFKPGATISRAEYLKLVIAASLPQSVSIDDSPTSLDHWVGKYLYVAETYGIVPRGLWTAENIDQPITRREMSTIVSKADMVLKGNQMQSTAELTFTDSYELSTEDAKFLQHAVSRGFINGYPEDNTFRPSNNMNRAEATSIIYKFTR